VKVFDHYAQYYDLLYSVKDYRAEVEYVSGLIEKFLSGAHSMLDVGCGTGTHGFLFAQRGFQVTGVDRSAEMVAMAEKKKEETAAECISFRQGDILSFALQEQFDVVVSLFHVMNYLTKSSDMAAGFANVISHVRPGGLFIFDTWYGPAVLSDLPKVGVRRFENDRVKVTRLVEPDLHPNRNAVDVNYEIAVQEKQNGAIAFIKETHPVRYFFLPEIETLLECLGVEILAVEEWLTGRLPGLNTFGVCIVGRRRGL
jgi:SAM-dependent methyltransferase